MSPPAQEYWQSLGLARAPFPPAAGYYSDDDLRRRLDLLLYLIQSGDELVLVRGEEGSGKSTLLRQFRERAAGQYVSCVVEAGAGLNAVRLLVEISQAYASGEEGGSGHSEDLAERLVEIQREGGTPLLAIDDAQGLSDETLNTLFELYERMGESGRLLRVVLFGDAEMERRLAAFPRYAKYRDETRSLELSPMSERQVEGYVAWCLAEAGLKGPGPFSEAQLRSIHEKSGGLPGRVNDVARRLLGGGAEGGVMNLTLLRSLNGRKMLPWVGVAALLVLMLIFQGPINRMIGGGAPEQAPAGHSAGESTPLRRAPGAMPEGALPNRIIRDEPVAPPVEPEPIPVAEPVAEVVPEPVVPVEPEPLVEPPAVEPEPVPAAESEPDPAARPEVAAEPALEPVAEAEVKPVEAPATEVEAKTVEVAEAAPESEPGKTPEPALEPEPEPEPAAPAIRDEAWLLEQNPRHYAVQVMGGAEREALAALAERHGFAERAALFEGRRNGKPWFALLYGVYSDLPAARAAMAELPRVDGEYAPWARSVASVQGEIKQVSGE